MNHEVACVQNYFFIETEVAHRRRELERALATAERHALARPKNGLERWSHLPHQLLARLRALATPRVPVTSWNAAGGPRAATLEGGGATAT